jgi:succinate-semialdehyde dehydrogenase/glutarate-semialdehyde dehydrogenase
MSETRNALEYESVNPYDGQSVQKFAALSDAELEVKIAKAASCYQTWKTKSYQERAVIVAKAAELMRGAVDQFAEHATIEMGKLINEARGEVSFSANILA